jgi:hypothetical protein
VDPCFLGLAKQPPSCKLYHTAYISLPRNTPPKPCTLIPACDSCHPLNQTLCLRATIHADSPYRLAGRLQTMWTRTGPAVHPHFCMRLSMSPLLHLSYCLPPSLAAPSHPTTQTGRTPADYVDPRLPGLSELLEAGRQLTPSRAPSAAAARTAHHHGSGTSSAAGSGGKHRSSPFPSPGGPHHPSGHHPTTIGAFRAAGGSPGPGGVRSRGGSGVVSPAGGQGGHKQQQYGTPQGRRSSSTYSSWDTSPSQVRWRGYQA